MMTTPLPSQSFADRLIAELAKVDVIPFIARCEVIVTVKMTRLRMEDLQSDIDRLANSVAMRYTDESCVMLHTEDLEAECKRTLVNVLEKGWLEKARTRGDFFRVLKSSMCNRMRSLVQQYRFTQKRTGIKPPPKNERYMSFVSCKPQEVSLDDPDAHIQVGEDERGVHEDSMDTEELIREINEHLNDIDRIVFKELCHPCMQTCNLAWLDAYRGQTNMDRVKIRITVENMAAGIGLSIEAFRESRSTIQRVTLRLREMHPEDQRYEEVVSRLAVVLNLQVPHSTEPMIVRRMFAIAARDNWQRVTPEVEADLTELGVVSPKFDADTMRCHGVLYQRGHKICEACGLKVSCAAQAANQGLGEISIHPKLLGQKLKRVPYILPNPTTEPPLTTTEHDQTILDYLFRNFRRVTHLGELYFQPKDFQDKAKLMFSVGERTIPLKLRFCKPNPLLRRQLVYVNKGYYAPDLMSAERVIEMINEHVRFAYV